MASARTLEAIPAADRRAGTPDYAVACADGLDFDAALALWETAETASVFNHPAWWRAALAAFGERRRVIAVSVRAGGRLCGYWPFWEKRLGARDAFARILEPVGARLTDYVMPLIAPGHDRAGVTAAMLGALARELSPRAMLLWPKADDAATADAAVGRTFPPGRHLVHRAIRRCPRMSLPDNYAELEQNWSGNHRSQVRRRKRRLAGLGALDFRVAGTREEMRAALPDLFAMHRRNWHARGAGSEFDDAASAAFLEHLVAGLPLDLLHCSQVRLDGRPVSSGVYFRRGRELLFYKGAFDPDHARCSPGMVHFAMAAEWGIANGFDVLDFMQGEEAYKFQWAGAASETVSHAIAPLSGWPVWAWNAKARRLIVEYKV